MISHFINRKNELHLLSEAWKRDRAEFIVVFGKRRIGKTRMIEEFTKNKEGIFYTAKESTAPAQITEIKNILADHFNDDFLRKQDIKEWDSLFNYLVKIIPQGKRFYFVIDEFSYLIKSDKSLVSILQRIWDKTLSRSKIFFIVSGSLLGMMLEHVLSYSSPLYGRRTRDLLIEELKIQDSFLFLKDYRFIEKMKSYGILGGVPSYLIVASGYKNTIQLIDNEFFNKQGFFYREPYYILSQDFKEVKTYFSILNAIALGKNSANEIANFCGIETRKIFPYLNNLLYLSFIKKETPICISTKYGIYFLKNRMLNFWFNFVDKNRTAIELENYKLDEKAFNKYLGYVFEDIIRDNTHLFSPFAPEKTGRWWYKNNEIDVVAINEKTKEIIFCECKWKDNVDAKEILAELKEKTKHVKWNNDSRKEYYAVFAKSFNKKINDKNILLFDLKDIEKAFS